MSNAFSTTDIGICLPSEIVAAGIIEVIKKDFDSRKVRLIESMNAPMIENTDIVILDAGSGNSALIKKLFRQYPKMKIIATLTSGRLSSALFLALASEPNVAAILTLDLPGALWRKSIKTVVSGKKYFTDDQKEWLANEITARNSASRQTPRETEILCLIKKDCSTKEIAERLNLSLKTIGTYVFRLRKKYQIKNLALLEV